VRENRTHGSMRRWEASRTSRLSPHGSPTPPADPVTSQGSADGQFKRALERRNFLLAWTTAADLPKVRSRTPCRCCCWPSTSKPTRYERAAPRWDARLCAEAGLTLAEAQPAVSALDALGGPGALAGGQALALSQVCMTPTV
jgi:hypothetical protein